MLESISKCLSNVCCELVSFTRSCLSLCQITEASNCCCRVYFDDVLQRELVHLAISSLLRNAGIIQPSFIS